METKPFVRHGRCVLEEIHPNRALNPRIVQTVKVEPDNYNAGQLNRKNERDGLLPIPQIKKEPRLNCDDTLNQDQNIKTEFLEQVEHSESPKKCDVKNKRFKIDLSEASTSKESHSLCYVKSEESGSLSEHDVKSEDSDSLCLDELKHKPVHSRIPMKSLGRPITRKDVLREVEEYFYLESRYLHFSENGEQFACTLCPIGYSSHGKMMSHLLSDNHMNTLWISKQTSVLLVGKIQILSHLVTYMRSGWSSVFGKYNPFSLFKACQKMESLLHTLVKKGSPCCPTKLQHSWYLCDCIMDTAAEDGKLQSYTQRQKVNFIKSGVTLGPNHTVKLEEKLQNVLALDVKVITKVETDTV